MNEVVKIEGLEEVVEFLQQLDRKLEASKALYAEAANVVEKAVIDSFETERSYSGTPWAPLKPETIKRKQKDPDCSDPYKKLYCGGNLQGSIYTDVTPVSAEIGISATANGYYYPMVQQFGNKKETVPARPFFPVDSNGEVLEGMREEIMEAISDGLDALIGIA